MPDVVGIRFKRCGKVYDFAIDGLQVRKGDKVVVDSEFGLSIGSVITDPRPVEGGDRDFKKVIRLAGEGDIRQRTENEAFAKEAMQFCLERVMARGLPMKLVCSEATLDRRRIVFYFTADGRIDFRELVKDLAAKFRTRIEMRQIGVRDKAKLVGGLGICGKELCCRLFLTSFEPISIKMAKQQELVLNTGKLSGTCGRLMCCLGYEYVEGGIAAAPAGKGAPAAEKEETPGTEKAETREAPSKEMPEPGPSRQAQQTGETEKPAEAREEQPKSEGYRKQKRRRRHRKRTRKNE